MKSSELVRELISRAAIPAGDDEIAILAAGYEAAHAAAARLYTVPVGSGVPAALLDPAPAEFSYVRPNEAYPG